MQKKEYVSYIEKTILSYINQQNSEKRQGALEDFLEVTSMITDKESAKEVANMVPALPEKLYIKWIGLFAESLFEKIDMQTLTELCSGTKENISALILIYMMFLESSRMETLKEYALKYTHKKDIKGNEAAFLLQEQMKKLHTKQTEKIKDTLH